MRGLSRGCAPTLCLSGWIAAMGLGASTAFGSTVFLVLIVLHGLKHWVVSQYISTKFLMLI